jgi:hypothetical protein
VSAQDREAGWAAACAEATARLRRLRVVSGEQVELLLLAMYEEGPPERLVSVGDPVRDPSTGGVVGTVLPAPAETDDRTFRAEPTSRLPVTWLRDAIAASSGRFVALDEPAEDVPVTWLPDGNGNLVGYHPSFAVATTSTVSLANGSTIDCGSGGAWQATSPPLAFASDDEKAVYEAVAAELERLDEHKAIVRARWPSAWANSARTGDTRPGIIWCWAILGTDLDVAPTGDTEAEAWAEAARRAGVSR